MYRLPKTSGNIYSAEDCNESNSSCINESSGTSSTQGRLERLPQDNHPLFNLNNTQISCHPKKTFIRLFVNILWLCLRFPFHFLITLCCSSSKSLAQKILSWAILFLLLFGAVYVGLFDGSIYKILGGEWEEFQICDLIQGKEYDLRSLMKANRILKRKALEIPPLKQQVQKLQSQFHHLRSGMNGITHLAVSEVLSGGYTSNGISTWSIEKVLKQLMEKLDEDDVQMPDYALKSAGASIVQYRTTRSYRHDGGNYFWLSFIMLPFLNPADVILQPNFYPGNCWSFPGNQGETVVRLSRNIIPKAVTLAHISKKVSPTGEISSAPKNFAIYALVDEMEEPGTFLGQFVYNIEEDFIQTFQLKYEPTSIRYVKLKVLSNWGNPKYTCIYRFRVHGDLDVLQTETGVGTRS